MLSYVKLKIRMTAVMRSVNFDIKTSGRDYAAAERYYAANAAHCRQRNHRHGRWFHVRGFFHGPFVIWEIFPNLFFLISDTPMESYL